MRKKEQYIRNQGPKTRPKCLNHKRFRYLTILDLLYNRTSQTRQKCMVFASLASNANAMTFHYQSHHAYGVVISELLLYLITDQRNTNV